MSIWHGTKWGSLKPNNMLTRNIYNWVVDFFLVILTVQDLKTLCPVGRGRGMIARPRLIIPYLLQT